MTGLFVFFGVGKISVGVVESKSNILSEGFTSLFGLKVIILDILEIKIIDKETSWEYVVLVDVFNEGLDAGSFDEFLL